MKPPQKPHGEKTQADIQPQPCNCPTVWHKTSLSADSDTYLSVFWAESVEDKQHTLKKLENKKQNNKKERLSLNFETKTNYKNNLELILPIKLV